MGTQIVTSKTFRQEALTILAECLEYQFRNSSNDGNKSTTSTSAACDLILVYQLLHQPNSVAKVLTTLFQKGCSTDGDNDDESTALLGLQLCFDLMDHGDQAFCRAVADGLVATPSSSEEEEASKEEKTPTDTTSE